MGNDGDKETEVFFDVTGFIPGVSAGSADEIVTELALLIAKITTGALVVWFSVQEFLGEVQKIRAKGKTP